MTATPIPRTLSLTAYGDLDTTALRELPAGRSPVETRLVGEGERDAAFELVREQLREGRQAFVVCPLVVESEKQQGKAAEVEAARLRDGELRDFEIGVLHGQMPSAEKAAAMSRFASGETDVLVATTVIEVGIDVANATVMVIEGAERYGVSQLHQLRGRVGRGEHRSFCLLVPEEAGQLARRRLDAVAGESDGFKLAEVDLALRGEGEVLGTRQHGLPRFAVAELPEDAAAAARGPRGGARPAARARLPRGRRPRPADGRRPPPLRRRRHRPDPAYEAHEGDRRRAEGPAAGRPAGLEGAADLRPRPRGDLLGARRAVLGARVLDLYCGTGALAIEALSRGAASAVLVDRDTRPALGNVESLGLGERAELVRSDVERWLAARADEAGTPRFDLVFVDAPYRLADRVGQELDTHLPHLLAEGGRAIVESGARGPLRLDLARDAAPAPLRRRRRRLLRPARERRLMGYQDGTVVCPGSYDPVTNGHLDIITRTSAVFERVVVGVVNNPIRKEKTLFTAEERKAFIEEATADLANVEVQTFSNLLVEFARELEATAIVKGLRAISDFEYEFEMAQLNRKLDPDIESIYVIASPHYSFLSSTGVKEMATFKGDVSDLVPDPVAAAMAERLGDR